MSQKQRVLVLLQEQDAVCVKSVPVDLGYTLRNRVSELRREGKNIVSERCRMHAHASSVLMYYIPREPQQVEMAFAEIRKLGSVMHAMREGAKRAGFAL